MVTRLVLNSFTSFDILIWTERRNMSSNWDMLQFWRPSPHLKGACTYTLVYKSWKPFFLCISLLGERASKSLKQHDLYDSSLINMHVLFELLCQISWLYFFYVKVLFNNSILSPLDNSSYSGPILSPSDSFLS